MDNFNHPMFKAREGAGAWLFKVLAGLLIVVFLGIHYIVNHLVAPGGLLSYADVIAYYQNPWIPIMEGFFLVLVITHSLVGVRSIILDLNPSDRTLRMITRILLAAGIVATVYGIWLLVIIAGRG
jgi:succinate dehydrogenase / fumarate reductase membrane anchor subunit